MINIGLIVILFSFLIIIVSHVKEIITNTWWLDLFSSSRLSIFSYKSSFSHIWIKVEQVYNVGGGSTISGLLLTVYMQF